jgi:uncharacterized protein YgbK (DUF1537 family)
MSGTQPTGPLVAFYGDDLTGSTDTLSVLAEAGLRVALFLEIPTATELREQGSLDAVGIAGWARAMTPAQMDAILPPAFAALADTGARIVHFKICSTFDSAPEIGSIGRALSIGRGLFPDGVTPIVVGQPDIGRWCAFGHLFAAAGRDGTVHRLDRHPTMTRHPVTPMQESDLRLHLARQGVGAIGLVTAPTLDGGSEEANAKLNDLLRDEPQAVLFDVMRPGHLRRIGQLIGARLPTARPLFAIGSSGLQQALLAGWEALAARRQKRADPGPSAPGPALILSGSRSPVNDVQVVAAQRSGFVLVELDPAVMLGAGAEADLWRMAAPAAAAIAQGRNVLAHTSLGPDDPRGAVVDAAGVDDPSVRHRLAHATGRFAAATLAQARPVRIGVAGGDTSSLAARAMGVRSLAYEYRVAAGVPVCRVMSGDAVIAGMPIMFKGGQMGPIDVFERFARGTGLTGG